MEIRSGSLLQYMLAGNTYPPPQGVHRSVGSPSYSGAPQRGQGLTLQFKYLMVQFTHKYWKLLLFLVLMCWCLRISFQVFCFCGGLESQSETRQEKKIPLPREVAARQLQPHHRLRPGKHCAGRSRAGCIGSLWDITQLAAGNAGRFTCWGTLTGNVRSGHVSSDQ